MKRTEAAQLALCDPRRVEFNKFELALTDLRRELSSERGPFDAFVPLRNLIYVIQDEYCDTGTMELITGLASLHPSRTICMRIDPYSKSTSEIWIALLQSELPASSSYSEFIQWTMPESTASENLPALAAMRISNLPTTLIWDNTMPIEHPLLRRIAPFAEHTVVSIIPPCGSASSANRFLHLRDSLEQTRLSDVAESMYQFWQDRILKTMRAQSGVEGEVSEIRVTCADEEITIEMIYILAWLTTLLRWQPQSFAWHRDSMTISFAENRRATILWNAARLDSEIELVIGASNTTIRIEPPRIDNRWDRLLRMQLDIVKDDRLRHPTLSRLKEFIGAIEMANHTEDLHHA